MAGYGQALLLDWSAFTRVLLAATSGATGRRLSPGQLASFADGVAADELLVCPPFRFGARYSARDATAFAEIDEQLSGFRQIDADRTTWTLADGAQSALAAAREVSHRVKFPELLVAACAHQAGAGVLHYDADFDTLSDHAGLEFESVWIAPRGSVD